jgi:hypothetical protein
MYQLVTRGAYGSEPRSEGVARPDMMEVLYNERKKSAYILHLPVILMCPTYPNSLGHIAKASTEARRLFRNCQLPSRRRYRTPAKNKTIKDIP